MTVQAQSKTQAYHARVQARLAELAEIIEAGGTDELHGWPLREKFFRTVEKLPKYLRKSWIDKYGNATAFRKPPHTGQDGRSISEEERQTATQQGRMLR